MGIFESKAALSAQLKGAEEIVLVAGVGDSEMGIGGSSERVIVGNRGSVCVDMDAETFPPTNNFPTHNITSQPSLLPSTTIQQHGVTTTMAQMMHLHCLGL